MINTLSCFHPPSQRARRAEECSSRRRARLISKVRTIAAYSYRRSLGLPFIYPDPKLPYVANFLHMMFSMPYEQHVASPEVVDALNLILLLHADHEQNCSTSTVRVVGSSKANLFASCAAGVCALWGPLHGGANVAVLEMLEQIHKGGMTAEQTLAAGQGQDERVPADGLRPPRLQELRPAGRDPQGAPPTRCWHSSASRTRCSTSPGSSRSWRSRTPTSSTASSIPTSTSTAASSCGRSASRRTCSP